MKKIKSIQGVKNFAIGDIKVVKKDGVIRIAGYANTKNVADRYGDIPTVYTPLRSFVYDIVEYLKNPVLLIDHDSAMANVAGKVTKIYEDNLGLYFEAEFSQSDYPLTAHARTVYAEGIANSISIGGKWYFEDETNPNHLTLAKIMEISLVSIPADPNATVEPITEEKNIEINAEKIDLSGINAVLNEYILSSELKKINEFFAKPQE